MYEQGKLYPILKRIMQRTNSAMHWRLTPRMSKINPWVIRCDVAMPREVFNLLHKTILGESRYGLEVSENSQTITSNFTKFRRLVILFNRFVECGGFEKKLKEGKGHVNVIVNSEKLFFFVYMLKDNILRVNLHYGYWNQYGISQH